MFEAGRNSFSEFSSNRTRPVSSETTLIATIAGAKSSFSKIAAVLVWSSRTVFVGFAVFGCVATDATEGETGFGVGLDTGTDFGVEGVGVDSCVLENGHSGASHP